MHEAHRGILSASSIGQSWYSTTLLLEGGRPFRVVNRNPWPLGFHSLLKALRTDASASGKVIGAELVLLLLTTTASTSAAPRGTGKFLKIARSNAQKLFHL